LIRVHARLGRFRTRIRKLYRDPVAFAVDFPAPLGRGFLRTLVLILVLMSDIVIVRNWIVRLEWWVRGMRLRPVGEDSGNLAWAMRSAGGAVPWFWPDRIMVRTNGDAVVCAIATDGRFLSGGSPGPGRGVVLGLSRSASTVRAYAFTSANLGVAAVPVASIEIFVVEFMRGVGLDTALKRSWPAGPRYAPHVSFRRFQELTLPTFRASDILISVLMPVRDPPERLLRQAIASVLAQTHSRLELCVGDDGSRSAAVAAILREAAHDSRVKIVRLPVSEGVSAVTNAAFALASGTVVCFIDHDDVLQPEALALIVRPFEDAGTTAAYSDEDSIDLAGRRAGPVFKTPFNYERLLQQNYVNHLFAIRADVLRRLGGLRAAYDGAQDHDLLLRLSETTPPHAIRHVPHILYHWRSFPGGRSFSQAQKSRAESARRRAVEDHLARQGLTAKVRSDPRGSNRIEWPLPESTSATVIIPTKDRPDLLEACVSGLLGVTDYGRLSVVIVDNSSGEESTERLEALARNPAVRIVRSPGPFNHSAFNNEVAQMVPTDLLVCLNDDILILEPHWLKEMASLAIRPGTGAVGAKLFYPDGRIQHAGVVLGLGRHKVAGHELRGAPAQATGIQSRMLVTRRVDAVTAACMVIERKKFLSVGGFDSEVFPISFNDVDLCLRLERAGFQTVWTPHARLVHVESASRGRSSGGKGAIEVGGAAERMKARWGDRLTDLSDYHPALTTADESFSLTDPATGPFERM